MPTSTGPSFTLPSLGSHAFLFRHLPSPMRFSKRSQILCTDISLRVEFPPPPHTRSRINSSGLKEQLGLKMMADTLAAADSDVGNPNCVKVELTRGEEMAEEKSTTCGSEVRAAVAPPLRLLPRYEYYLYVLKHSLHRNMYTKCIYTKISQYSVSHNYPHPTP